MGNMKNMQTQLYIQACKTFVQNTPLDILTSKYTRCCFIEAFNTSLMITQQKKMIC